MNFTKDQQKAINTKNKQILLSAAAGSGKTAVLIEHIFNIITDEDINVCVDELLVLTFTKKASKEMSERLEKRLNLALLEEKDEEKIYNLTEQINLLKSANISTIHSFCRNVIKQNFHIIDIDPSFKQADEAEIILLKNEALMLLLEEEYEKNDETFLDVVEIFSDKVLDNGLLDIILNLYDFSMSNPFPKKWLNEVIETYDIKGKDINDLTFIKSLKQNIVSEYENILSTIELILEEIHFATPLVSIYDLIVGQKNDLLEVIDLVSDDISLVYNKIITMKNELLPRTALKKEDKEMYEDLYKSIKEIYKTGVRDKRADIENKYFYKPFNEFIEDIVNQKQIVEKLVYLVNRFDEIFSSIKRDRNVIDFNDLEHLAIKILVDENNQPTEIAKEYQEKFYEIMVDEFQDTNMVQETILNSILNEKLPYKNKYMVGDVKQSIYKFRKADPQIFIDKYNSFSKNDDENNLLINLSKNFRSRKGVIDGTNYIFEKIMIEKFGGINYDENVKLHLGREQITFDDDFITFLLLEEDKKEEKEELENAENEVDKEVAEISKVQKEAILIANEIEKIMSDENHLMVEENGTLRRVKLSDITILLRSFTNVDVIISELNKRNIDSVAKNKSDYFYQIEVKTILAILSVIDNRTVDISVATALTSKIYDLTPEELLIIRKSYGNEPLYYSAEKYADEHSDIISDKLNPFLEHIDKWKSLSHEKSITELLFIIYNDTNYLNIVLASSKGERAYGNLMLLVEKASEYEKSTMVGLFNFLNFIEKSAKSKVKIETANDSSELDAVNIMTIHSSKGLEFKVVFQSLTGKMLNQSDERRDFVLHDDVGVGFKYFDKNLRVRYDTLIRNVIIDKMTKERLYEEIRLLYVSLTRAVDKLYITGMPSYTKQSKIMYKEILSQEDVDVFKYISRAKNYFDFLLPALIRHRDFAPFREYLEMDSVFVDNSDTKFEVRIINVDDILNEGAEHEKVKILADLEEIDMSNIDISKIVDKKPAQKTEATITISEIKEIRLNKKFEKSKIYNAPKFINKEENEVSFSGAEKGSILHKYLENIELNRNYTQSDLDELSEKLIKKDVLNSMEIDTINFQKVDKFLQSSLFERIKNSEKVYREKAFAIYINKSDIYGQHFENDEKLLLHGIIDLYFYEGDEVVLVDYKTDYTNDNNLSELKEEYKLQLSIYKMAIERAEHKKVKNAYVYSFFRDEIIEIL